MLWIPLSSITTILARFDVPDEFRADTIQRAAFGGNDIACVIRQPAQAQRTESLGIPCRDELFRGHYRKGIRPFYLIHRLFDSLLNGACFQACLGNCVGNDLGVAGAVEYRALKFVLPAQVEGIDEISVVCNSEGAP